MSENTVQIDKRVVANFRVANAEPGLSRTQLIEEQWTISKAILFSPGYIPPKTLSIIATLEIEEEQLDLQSYAIAYLDISRDRDDPVVTPRSGKVLGPLVTYNQEIPSAELLFQHQFDQKTTVRIYPHTDELFGLWVRLLPPQE